MKKFFLFLCFASALVIIPGLSTALPGLSICVGPSLTVPLGDFADNTKNSWGVAANAFAGIPIMNIKLGGRVAYNSFGIKNSDENFSILEITPSIRYSFFPLMVTDVYLQAGGGYYRLDSGGDTDNQIGINAGFGIEGTVTPTMSVFVMPLYNLIFREDENTSYLSINAGVKF